MVSCWDWVGARWWKFDFHAHTTKSECYGQGPNQTALKNRTPQEWLLDYMRAGIDCVAVTDHNSGEWIDTLKDAYEQLYREQHSEFRPLFIFPGSTSPTGSENHLASFRFQNTFLLNV